MAEILAESFLRQEQREEISLREKKRMIVHLARVFSRNYGLKVMPSGKKGLWACGIDKKVEPEVMKYVQGQRETLDDLPAEAFEPKRILYDESAIEDKKLSEITPILRHEASHAKRTDFRLMFEGQRMAKDDGFLPTTFWIMWEGMEDPRISNIEGRESRAIDAAIRKADVGELEKRLAEKPIGEYPMIMQFAYNSLNHWLRGESIGELEGTEVGEIFEKAKPLISQYMQNTDLEQRRGLQEQIWDIVKEIETKSKEKEELKEKIRQDNIKPGNQGKGEDQQAQGQSGGQGKGEGSGGEGESQGIGVPSGETAEGKEQPEEKLNSDDAEAQDGQKSSEEQQRESFLEKLRNLILGKRDKEKNEGQSPNEAAAEEERVDQSKDSSEKEQKEEKDQVDLTQFSQEQLDEIRQAIENLPPDEREKLSRRAREILDEMQKDAMKENMQNIFELERDKQTGNFQLKPRFASEQEEDAAEREFEETVQEVEEMERAENEQRLVDQQIRDERQQFEAEQRRENIELENAGFDPETEREKFFVYRDLERAMQAHIRNFRSAMEKIVPRQGERKFEGHFYTGPKFDKRQLVRKLPIGDEKFWLRAQEVAEGKPRLFVALLIDNSGSMDGVKMQEARKSAIFFAEVLRDMEVPFMIESFGDSAETLKDFKENFDDASDRNKPRLIDGTDASGGNTNLHQGVEKVIDAMNNYRRIVPDSHGLIFVITDGGANRGLVGEELKDYVDEHKGRLTFKGFGLSRNEEERQEIQQYLNLYFGEQNCAYPQNFDDLPDEAFRLLRVNLMRFSRFIR